MRTTATGFAAAAASVLFVGAAFAQHGTTQGHDMAAMELPEACRTGDAPDMAGMEAMRSTISESQQAMMQAMTRMHGLMSEGMMAEDPDVAFACAMIPHHMGAIVMAEAQLARGDSDEMKQMARMIVEAQKREIEQLTQWIEAQAQ